MKSLFNEDSMIMRILTALFDLLVLNLLTLALCVPVITGGAALTALHYVSLKMARNEDGYIIKPYFKAFKDNFGKATLIWLIFLALGIVLGTDLYVIRSHPEVMPTMMRILVAAVAILVCMLLVYVLPLQSHFENSIPATFKNSIILSIANFPRTLAITAIWIIPLIILVVSVPMWPLVIMYGISAPAYFSARIYSPVFEKFEPEPETVTSDEEFILSDEDND